MYVCFSTQLIKEIKISTTEDLKKDKRLRYPDFELVKMTLKRKSK